MQFQNYYIATKTQGSDETPYSYEEIVLKTSLVKTLLKPFIHNWLIVNKVFHLLNDPAKKKNVSFETNIFLELTGLYSMWMVWKMMH